MSRADQTIGPDGLTRRDRDIIRAALARCPEVRRTTLFGSRAMGTFGRGSDIDLALEGPNLTPRTLARIADNLEESDLPYKVDLLLRDEHLDARLEAHIRRHGKVFGWEWMTLEDVRRSSSDGLATGPFGSSVSAKYFQSSGIPLIRGSNLSEAVDERLVEEDYVFVSEEKAAEFPRAIARHSDLVFTCWGTIGQVGLVDEHARFERYLISNKQMKLSPDPAKANSLFLYYLFSSPKMQATIQNYGIGSSVPGFNLGQLRSIKFLLPSLPEQSQIARVLGALDDKIEHNRRTARALERLARAIFRAWFVDFEPVKAKAAGATSFPSMPQAVFDALPTRFVDSEIGPVPEGWDVGTLDDVLRERKQRINPSDETLRLPYVPIECITAKQVTLEESKDGSEAKSSLIRFVAGDILFGAMRPYFHKVCLAPYDGTTRTTCFVLNSRTENDRAFSLMLASETSTVEYATSHSIGSTIPYAKWQNSLAAMPCVIPPANLRAAFADLADDQLRCCQQLVRESGKLMEMRDYLLPMLLSGAVRVDAANEEFSA